MFMVQCNACGTMSFVNCECPPGHDQHAHIGSAHPADRRFGHHDQCLMGDLGATVDCACCDGSSHPGLSHDMAAHLGHPNMHAAQLARAVTADGDLDHEPDHDGEHGRDNPDCAVCRPVTITVMPGGTGLTAQLPIGG
jgi:hypothetical protein